MTNPNAHPAGKSVRTAAGFLARLRSFRRWLPMGLAYGAQVARSENQVDYRYESYQEDNDRMRIETHSVYFEQQLIDSVTAKGELVYDGISGSTPTGTVSPSGKISLTHLTDIRHAANLELDCRLGTQTLTPGFAYSKESDYKSYAISLNDAIEFNEKNTILQLGVSHNFDSVSDASKTVWHEKDSTEGIVGISQLLSPKTIFTAAFTFGNDSGSLTDPYRLAGYVPTGFPFSIGVPERRPSHRNKEIIYTSLTCFIEPLNASIEGSYRFYHDSYGVFGHTAGLTWHQWLGRHLIVEPMFRFYEQSAADFYRITFSGPFSSNPPGFHSSDYRLSQLYTLDFGLQATAIINDHLHIVAGYHRYEMNGLDGQTSPAMYPRANIFTVGLSLLW